MLFNRLLSNKSFRQDCKNRWIILRNTLWTQDYLFDEIFDIYNKIKDKIELDSILWFDTIQDYCKEGNKDDLEEYIEKLIEYIPKRLEFCDNYFNNLDNTLEKS
jgi:hypothetical protein